MSETIKLIITIATFGITLGAIIWKLSTLASQIKNNTDDIEEIKKHDSEIDTLLNQINISVAQISTKLDMLMAKKENK